ncbi:MAG TPA: NUDIX domain-containing protein [Gemmatimonadaceae bacterium]|nr:NUDIX domain-containing protein [Gemmatimonadaceae bacterium]
MTGARVATVDVYPLRRIEAAWEALVMRRAAGTRCTGAWETVHGRLEPDERPDDAARRELREETGFTAERLYNVSVQPFYLHQWNAVTLAVVFAAVVPADAPVTLGPEHDTAEWLPLDAAITRYAWPRSKTALAEIAWLLRDGDAGAVEDVLRL